MKSKYVLYIFCVILLIIFFGCAAVVVTRISDLNERPNHYHNKIISLSGRVGEVISFPILGIGVYQLDDGTGKIWVKPSGEIPNKDERIKVSGEVKVGLTISGKNFGVILIEKNEKESVTK